jgi:hypothetical protein
MCLYLSRSFEGIAWHFAKRLFMLGEQAPQVFGGRNRFQVDKRRAH